MSLTRPWSAPDADVAGDIRRAIEELRDATPLSTDSHAEALRELAVSRLEHEVREDIRADFLNDDGLMPWER